MNSRHLLRKVSISRNRNWSVQIFMIPKLLLLRLKAFTVDTPATLFPPTKRGYVVSLIPSLWSGSIRRHPNN